MKKHTWRPIDEDRKTTPKMLVSELPSKMQGPPTNRFGRHQMQRMRGFKGQTYGAASKVIKLTEAEIAAHTIRLKNDGII